MLATDPVQQRDSLLLGRACCRVWAFRGAGFLFRAMVHQSYGASEPWCISGRNGGTLRLIFVAGSNSASLWALCSVRRVLRYDCFWQRSEEDRLWARFCFHFRVPRNTFQACQEVISDFAGTD